MYDLESSIAQWRREMLNGGISTSAVSELESHLREEIDHQLKTGVDGLDALHRAIQKIGQPAPLVTEFDKSDSTLDRVLWLNREEAVRFLALPWLVFCAGGFTLLGMHLWSANHENGFRATPIFWWALLMEGLYLRSSIASIRMLFGNVREGRVIWLLAILEVIGAVVATIAGHTTWLTWPFTALGIATLWYLRPAGKIRNVTAR